MKPFFHKIGLLLLMHCVVVTVKPQQAGTSALVPELQKLQSRWVPDGRVAILDIELKDSLGLLVVTGCTDLPLAKVEVIDFFKQRGIAVIDSIRVLPDAVLGDKTWALSTLSVSNLRARPGDASELVSQAIMGTPMRVLDVKGNWYRVQTPDRYIGWMDAGGLALLSAGEWSVWKNAERCVFSELNGRMTDIPRKSGQTVSDLVRGDLMQVIGKTLKYWRVSTPDGRVGYVPKKQTLLFNRWINLEPKATAIIASAHTMMGSPYLWGGTSGKGMDCSGFVKTVFYSQGIVLARDASQQARYGEAVPLDGWRNLLPGDLLFFGVSDARITHVGIYLGNSYFIHASGRVHVSSLNPNDPLYVATRHHVATRRVLGANEFTGIVRVKEHPWYR